MQEPSTMEAIQTSRPASGPTASAATGGISALIAASLAQYFVGENPDLVILQPVLLVSIGGFLGGIGNASRNFLASGKGGPLWLLANLFAWLG